MSNKNFFTKKRCVKAVAVMLAALLVSTELFPALNVFASELQETNVETVSEEVAPSLPEENFVEDNFYQENSFVLSIDDGKYEEGNEREIFDYSESVNDEEGGWSFNAETLTLTLHGFNGHYIGGSGAFTIVLSGENTLTIKDTNPNLCGIENNNSKLVITDDEDESTLNDSLKVIYSGEKSVKMINAGSAKAGKHVCIEGGTLSLQGESTQSIYGIFYNTDIANDANLEMNISSSLSSAKALGGNLSCNTSGDVDVTVTSKPGKFSYCFAGIQKSGTGNISCSAYGADFIYSDDLLNLYENSQGRIELIGVPERIHIVQAHRWYCEGYDAFLKTDNKISDLDGNIIQNPVLYYAEKELQFVDTDNLNIPGMYVGDSFEQITIPLEDLVYGGAGNFTFSAKGLPEGLSFVKRDGKTYISGIPVEAQPAGEAEIIVTDEAGNTDSITISVGEILWKNVVEELIFDRDEISLEQNTVALLDVSFNPEIVDSYIVSYEFDDEAINVVSNEYSEESKSCTAKITALDKAGVTSLKVIAKAGGVTKEIPVYVKEKMPQAFVGQSAFCLEGLDANAIYEINGTRYESSSQGTINILDSWCGQDISLTKVNPEVKCYSGTQIIRIPDTLLSNEIRVDMDIPVVGEKLPTIEDIRIYDVKNIDTNVTDIYLAVTDVTCEALEGDTFTQAGSYDVQITLSTIGDMLLPSNVIVDMPDDVAFGQTTVSSDRKSLIINWKINVKEAMPEISFYLDWSWYLYTFEYVVGFEPGVTYMVDGKEVTAEYITSISRYGIITDYDWAGRRIKVYRVSEQGQQYNSDAVYLDVPVNLLPNTMKVYLPEIGIGKPVITEEDISIKPFEWDQELNGKYVETYDFSLNRMYERTIASGRQMFVDEDYVFGDTFEPGQYRLRFNLSSKGDLRWLSKTQRDELTDGYDRTQFSFYIPVVQDPDYQFSALSITPENEYSDYFMTLDFVVRYATPQGYITEDGLYIAGLEANAEYNIDGVLFSSIYLPQEESYGFKIPLSCAGKTINLVRYCRENVKLNSKAQTLTISPYLLADDFEITVPLLKAGETVPYASEVDIKYSDCNPTSLKIWFPVTISYDPEISSGSVVDYGKMYETTVSISVNQYQNFRFNQDKMKLYVNGESRTFEVKEGGKALVTKFTQYIREAKPEGFVYENKYIAGLLPNRTYFIQDTILTTSPICENGLYGVKIKPEWNNQEISVKLLSDIHENCNSEEQVITVTGVALPDEIMVVMPAPEFDKPVTDINDVKIYDRKEMTDITNEYLKCTTLSWSPQVQEKFEGGIGYTAWLEFETCNGFLFGENTKIWLGENQVNTEFLADNTRVQFGYTFGKTMIPGFWAEEIPDQRYTGKAIKPTINVYYGNTLLSSSDYTVSYKNNTNAAAFDAVDAKGKSVAPKVVIKGKGNFTGTIEKTFTILPINLDDYKEDTQLQQILSINSVYAAYTGKVIKGVPTVKLNGKTLTQSAKQYTLSYPQENEEGAYLKTGTYEILIEGSGKNFIGKTSVSETISSKLISKVSVKTDKSSYPYNSETGITIPDKITVKDGKKELVYEQDYTVSYECEDRIGTAYVVVTGINDYSGTKKVSYKITGKKLTSKMIVMNTLSLPYTGDSIDVNELSFSVKDGTADLEIGKHFSVELTGELVKAGTFNVVFNGINGYTGTVVKKVKINKVSVSSAEFSYDKSVSYVKDSCSLEPVVSVGTKILVKDIDYKIVFVNIGKAEDTKKEPYFYIKGLGNYTGDTKNNPQKFAIVKANISDAAIISADDILYKNKNNNFVPKVKLTDKISGKNLTAKKDYSTSFKYEIYDEQAGEFIEFTAKKVEASDSRIRMRVTIEAMNNFTGLIQAEYEIYSKDISKVKVASISPQIYTGKPLEPQPVITVAVKNGNKTVYEPLDKSNYIIEYANNINKGTATIYIYGCGEYGGVKKVTFKISTKKLVW